MGRRKIEITPIQNERNRSVTFLKRKNGLFKKAYELGVLCSVDVAVIIFEERPGHHLKLYQYSSCDVHDIVQRHIRYDGERDNRGPNDFSGAAGKADDLDGEDEEQEDEDEAISSRGTKRAAGGKPRGPVQTSLPIDLDYSGGRSNMMQPPPSLPLSSDRHLHGRHEPPFPGHKKPRLLGTRGEQQTSSYGGSPFFPVSSPPPPPPSFIPGTFDNNNSSNNSFRGGGSSSGRQGPYTTSPRGVAMYPSNSMMATQRHPSDSNLLTLFDNEPRSLSAPAPMDWPTVQGGGGGGHNSHQTQSGDWLEFLSNNSSRPDNPQGSSVTPHARTESWERGRGELKELREKDKEMKREG